MAIIRLTTCTSAIEANLLKNLLENEGIECFLTNENFSTLMPGYTGMLGSGVQIMIDENDKEKSLEIIGQKQNKDVIKCPKCGSENIGFSLGENKMKKIFLVILSIFLFIPFNNIKSTFYCKDCKNVFKSKNYK